MLRDVFIGEVASGETVGARSRGAALRCAFGGRRVGSTGGSGYARLD